MIREIGRDQVIYSMSDSNKEVLEIDSGDEVVFYTEDCFSNQITKEDEVLSPDFDFAEVNPATGPVWIRGAEKGDSLKITIRRIELDEQGVVEVAPGLGVLGGRIKEANTEIVKIRDGKTFFRDQVLDLNPMIGVIGVAPADGESIECGIPGHHGSNLDTKENSEGNILRLPVFVNGGKLALGDLHAAMGDGEVCGTGVEIRGKVTLKIELEKNTNLKDPFIESNDAYFFLASAEKLEDAVSLAVTNGVDFISKKKSLPLEKAAMLASIACDLGISQVVNPLVTVKLKVPKKIL